MALGNRAKRVLRAVTLLATPLLLGGCNFVVLHPAGDIAVQQRNLVLASTALMLVIIVPVIALTFWFAWRYRESNKEAVYDPQWHHSTQLEVLIWSAPLVIVVALGALTWISTHTLDPFRGLSRLGPKQAIPQGVEPLNVEVVALDWKWLFFYPDQGIATVNELAAPVNRPISFKITSSSVMNAFYVPALAGMIYAMPGMQTQMHAVINKEGVYHGLSSHYSGAGFSNMTFKFHGLSQEGFDTWIAKAKSQGGALTREDYLQLERPSERVPVAYYKTVADGLFDLILNMCVTPGKLCARDAMAIDLKGGGAEASRENYNRLKYDDRFNERGDEAPGATAPATGRAPRSEGNTPRGVDATPGASAPAHDKHH